MDEVFGMTIQILFKEMLTNAKTQKLMWATLFSNPHEIPPALIRQNNVVAIFNSLHGTHL